MPDFENNEGFKMPGVSIISGTQKHTDATEAKRAADIETTKAGETPNKWIMQAAGMLIGANKKRQATKDAAEADKGAKVDSALANAKVQPF